MRFETEDFTATVASHIGHHHSDRGDNCQDTYSLNCFEAQGQQWVIGVVCDGCGGADIVTDHGTLPGRSEVGSALLSSFIVRESQSLIEQGMSLYDTVNFLFEVIKRYVSSTMWFLKPDEIAYYIQRYWLATIRGVIINKTEGYLFTTGDGISEVKCIPEHADKDYAVDQHDPAPDYLAYACIPRPADFGLSKRDVREGFTFFKFQAALTQRIMLATDGFGTHCERKLIATEITTNTKLPRSLDGEQWGKKGKTGLKRWLNVASDKGYFDDDIALLLIERKI